jgi:hypothetical protein
MRCSAACTRCRHGRWRRATVRAHDLGEPVDGPYDPAAIEAGALDARVLGQTTYWVDGNGESHLLTEMAPQWRLNIGAFLVVKARCLHAVEGLYEASGAGAPAGAYLAMLASGRRW